MDRQNFEQFAAEFKDSLSVATEAPAPPVLGVIGADELQTKVISPIRWIVNGLLPAGLTFLASPPKLGKSWAALDLCLAASTGGLFLGYQCNKTGVLYLALEDSERRVQSRMKKILGERRASDNFRICTEAPTLGNGLVDALETYISQHHDTGLVIVDTFQKVRDLGGGRDVYGKDYADVVLLKRFADKYNLAVLVIHHLRKMGDEGDPFARISGSTGISGAADAMLVLEKERRSDDTATLHVTGRDVEMREIVLSFNTERCTWRNMGDAEAYAAQQAVDEYRQSPLVVTVKRLLAQSPNGWDGTTQDLMDAGRHITGAQLATSTQALTNEVKKLEGLLLEYDEIAHTRKRNGSGGGRHVFSYVMESKWEQSDFY